VGQLRQMKHMAEAVANPRVIKTNACALIMSAVLMSGANAQELSDLSAEQLLNEIDVSLDLSEPLQVILDGDTFDLAVFVKKLKYLSALSQICPESKITAWSDCFGVYEFPWGDRYKGTWDGDKSNGFGQIIKKNGDQYIGDFVNYKSEGCGIYVFSDGETVSGFWKGGDLIQEQKQCRRL
jgi:hypothetical protein